MTDPLQSLFDKGLSKKLSNIVFSDSHGAFEDHLGAGGLYYALATMIRSQVSVCIGSGGGFVPRLLRQAQQDLGLVNAHTYLVDANLPDLGFGHPMQPGGWLTPENDLQTATPGLSILRMLSKDAAQLFASARMTLDYLHIDGDHSARGVVADLSDYLPLLSSKAIVSLHDLRMESVRQAMVDIGRKYPSLEWVTFSEVGNGTAVLRRRSSDLPPRLPLSMRNPEDPKRITLLDETIALHASERSQAKARYERWHYLTTPAYRSRYDIIAKSVDSPNHTVVEVGGYPNSIVRHLAAAKRVIAIEPYAPPEYLAEINAAAKERGIDLLVKQGTLGGVEVNADLLGPYALVALGLDVSAGCDSPGQFHAALGSLVDLAGHAEIIAVETPGYPPSQVALQCLFACIEPRILQDITLDLSQDPVADEYFVKDERAKRRLVVFRPEQILTLPRRESVLSSSAALFPDFKARLQLQTKAYDLGDTVHFRAGSGAEGFLTSGWSHIEARHTWAIGKLSRLELDISGLPDNPRPIHLRLDLIAFLIPGKLPFQRLSILVNGKRLYKEKVRAAGFLDVPVPSEVLLRRHPIQIVLIHPDGAKPSDWVQNSVDGRVLSIGLRSIALINRAETD
ncbi:MAG TPA: class I SAM-dependent methyltransferase [Stellaceae bacterium]|nr:class I SAM-dependent methyltransferase [Stellaceae bacterium]